MSTTLMLTCRVADYETWRPQFDASIRELTQIRTWRLWRGQDDPNRIVIIETYESRELAEQLLVSDEMQATMAAHGIDLSSIETQFLDEEGAWSR